MKPTTEFLSKIKITPLLETLRFEDIDDHIYFSEKYSGYVSNSRLGLINPAQDGSPKNYFEGLTKHNKFSDSLIFGSAIHECVLQPESFYLVNEVDRPTAKTGYIADYCWDMSDKSGKLPLDDIFQTAAVKFDYYSGLLTKTKLETLKKNITPYFKQRAAYESTGHDVSFHPIYLDPKSRDRLNGCLTSLATNAPIQALLNPLDSSGKELPHGNEKTILLDVQIEIPDQKPFVLRLKSKLDNYTIDEENNVIIVNDLKTTSKWCKYFNEAFTNFHYFREMGMYTYLLNLVSQKYFNLKNPEIQSNCLVVETMPDYMSSVYKVSNNELVRGFKEFTYLLRLVAFYTAFGYE